MNEQESNDRVAQIEHAMNLPEFWQDPKAAQEMIKELQSLKDAQEGKEQYDRFNAVLSIVAGAGGADAEDFARMLVEMYGRYADNHNYSVTRIHENENDHGGYRNITMLVEGKNAYGNLKYEAGVHRLVRISPFNANDKRQTSFVLVEVSPEFKDAATGTLPEDVAADLVAPFYFHGAVDSETLHFSFALLFLEGIHLTSEERESALFILVLASLGGDVDGNICRDMHDTDGSFALVNVLSAGATCFCE